ncbi:MAG: IS1595 family transposase [Cellulosilyticaceae bacterium]
MTDLTTLRNEIRTLSDTQLRDLFNFIGEVLSMNFMSQNINTEFKENRFKSGQVCIHCGSLCVVKNGKLNNKQRYKCKDCKKHFNDLTLSSLSCTKLPLEKWLEYAKCMLLGLSIRKSAAVIEVSVKTSFYMRHKILDCLREYMGIGEVKGIIEMDETFQALSFKGNHKKSGFKMPRPSRCRGGEVKTRGISHEQVCIATALDRNNNIILEPVCTGRISHKDLERLFEGRIQEGSILCTDSHKSYIQFAKDFSLDHKQIKRGRHKEGIYHINHLNSLHSLFKGWIRHFKGVSTKFLINYLYWFKWLQKFHDEKDIIRGKNILVHSAVPCVDTRIVTYRGREAIFC